MKNLELRCPCCRKSNKLVILQLHWTKKYHTLLCGNCKLELNLRVQKDIPIDLQLKNAFDEFLKFECMDRLAEIEAKVKTMTFEEKIRRLEELDKKKGGNK